MLPLPRTIRTIHATAVLLLAAAAEATDIYRWVDENGRTQVSDVVPEKYRKYATRVDSGRYETSPEQRKEAFEGAAKARVLADEGASRRREAMPSAPASAASAALAT